MQNKIFYLNIGDLMKLKEETTQYYVGHNSDITEEELAELPSCVYAGRSTQHITHTSPHTHSPLHYHVPVSTPDHDTEMNGVEEGYYPNGSPYRIQRHAANIRERKRMLRVSKALFTGAMSLTLGGVAKYFELYSLKVLPILALLKMPKR
ncbi:hypothetical protein G5I_00440 [Acromyrmex echinatior]|uniref:Uncharacterized protein n=1 Tax=Acromyrmex echinatior TaxID=103372 RepID=F4W4W2_ACREC|nr:hypothetical protein G5I_00440 [Acromyrmex echinatior]